ncbi:hypothetical protein QYE76_065770 [Lolium multiflorum]|uniref:RNase H type-1 domain-containing protein n=1 Tax=Lolium multiflorum TaxID=4521 RepID=A0AAD8S9U9_LOLMU|nr:hypothetical protein QYE76_065770 [Lolium multiflorum]
MKYILRMTFSNASNNEAEYEALIHGMKMAKACGATRLKIFGDSQLVAQQVMNKCDAVNDSMIAYKELYNELERLFDGCEVNHISRLSNDEADVLANIGSQCLPIPPGVFWEEISERSTKPKKTPKQPKKKEKPKKDSGAAAEPEANISNVDPNNVPLASLVAQEENVDVNFIKNNNFNNNAYRNNSGNNYRPYPSANGNGYGNSYGNSYNNNRSVPRGLEAMLKEFISTQTAFNKSVEEKLAKIDIIASRVDRLASDVDLLKLKVMANEDIDNKITTTANAIQVRINENIRLMAELRARWDREENEKLAKENNVAKVWTITTTSNDNDSHVAAPPTINGKIIGVGNVSTPSAKRTKLPEIAKTAETACDKTAEIFSNLGDNDPIAVAHNDLHFDDCHISEVIKFLQKLAKSPNASAINLAFTKHITNALIKAREEKLKLETSIPRKLEDGWEPIIKMKFNDFDCNALCDLGASISVMPKKIYDILDLPPLKNC